MINTKGFGGQERIVLFYRNYGDGPSIPSRILSQKCILCYESNISCKLKYTRIRVCKIFFTNILSVLGGAEVE